MRTDKKEWDTEPFMGQLASLETLGMEGSFIKEAYYPTVKKADYYEDKLLIGRLREKDRVTQIWLPANESFRCLITGATRAGKTWLSQRILSTAFKGGNAVCILIDVKDEFSVMRKPLQPKFSRYLAKDESPTSLPIKIYRPQFLIKNEGHCPPNNIPAQLSFDQCSYSDLVTLLSVEKSDIAQMVLGMVYGDIFSGEVSTFDELKDSIMDVEKVTPSQKRMLIAKLELVKKFEVIGNDHPFDFAQDIVEGHIPILNMAGFEDLGRDFSSFPQAYVAVILRGLIRAKRRKIIDKKLYIFLDELARFCPAFGEPTSKKEIREAIDLTTGQGINMIMSTQDTSSIPEEVLNQSRYIFLPNNAVRPLIESVLKNKGIWRMMSPTFTNEVLNSFKAIPKWHWVMIDSVEIKEVDQYNPLESAKIFRPYAPLARHKETEGKR